MEDRKTIGWAYLTSWFPVDSIAIIPLDVIIQSAQSEENNDGVTTNKMLRLSKIGRMYKLIKLTRLLRVLKIVKEKSKFLKYI